MTTLGNAVLNVVLNPGQFLSQLTTLQATTGAALAGMGLAFGRFVDQSVNKAADFEEQMSAVAAAAGAPAEDLAKLKQAALDAGAATSFSATGAAQAMEEMAKAGLNVNTILEGGLAGTLSLAAATGIKDLGYAAELAADAIGTFGLQGNQMGMVADVITNAANKSSMSVEQWKSALQSVGPVIASNNISVQQFSGFLALMAKNAVKGADAGQGLKTIIMQLQSPSQQAAGLMKKLGLSAYDANGNFKDLGVLFGDIQDKFKDLSVEQRNLAAQVIFGAAGLNTFNVIMKEGKKGLVDMTNAMNETGAASQTAQTRMDNFRGAQEQLAGSFETLQIAFGQLFLNGLTKVTNILIDIVNALTKAVGWIAQLQMAIGIVLKPLKEWYNQSALAKAIVEGLTLAVGVLAGGAGIYLLYTQLTVMAGVVKGLVLPALTSLYAALGPILIPLGLVAAAVAALYIAYKTNFGGIKVVVDDAVNWMRRAFTTIPIWFKALVDSGSELYRGLKGVFLGIGMIFQGFNLVIYGALIKPTINYYNSTVKWFGEARAAVASAVGNMIAFVVEKFNSLRSGVSNGLAAAGKILTAFISGVQKTFSPLAEFLASIGIDVGSALAKMVGGTVDFFNGLVKAGAENLEAARAEAARQRAAAEAEAQRARDEAARKQQEAAAKARQEYMNTHQEVKQGLDLIQAGAGLVVSSTKGASTAITGIMTKATTASTAQMAKAATVVKGVTNTAKTATQIVKGVSTAAGGAGKALDLTKDKAKKTEATLAQIMKLVPEAKRLQLALDAAEKSGNGTAIRRASFELEKFKRANNGATEALAMANREIQAHNKILDQQRQKREAAARQAEAQAAREKGFKDRLASLNATIRDNIKDGKVSQSQLDGWKRQYQDLAKDAARAKVNLAGVAGAEIKSNSALMNRAAAAAKATAAAEALHKQNQNTIKYLPKATDKRLAELKVLAQQTKNTELLSAVKAEQASRIADAEARANNMIKDAQEQVTNAVKDNTSALEKQAAALEAQAKLVPSRAAALRAEAAALRQLDQLNKMRDKAEGVNNSSKSLIERSGDVKGDIRAQLTEDGNQKSPAENLIRDINAQIEAEKKLQTELQKKIAAGGKFKAQYQQQLVVSQNLVTQLGKEATALRTLQDRLTAHTAAQKLAKDSSDLLEKAQSEINDANQQAKNPLLDLADALEKQAGKDGKRKDELLAQAKALRTLYVEKQLQKSADERVADSQKLLADATEKINELNDDGADSIDRMINSLNAQAEVDSENADALRAQAYALSMARFWSKEREAQQKREAESTDLLTRAQQEITNLTDDQSTSVSRLVTQLRAQAEADSTNAVALRARATELENTAKKAEQLAKAQERIQKSQDLIKDAKQALDDAGTKVSDFERRARELDKQANDDPLFAGYLRQLAVTLRAADLRVQALTASEKVQGDTESMLADARQMYSDTLNEQTSSLLNKAHALDEQAAKERGNAKALRDAIKNGADNAVQLEAQAVASERTAQALTTQAAALTVLDGAQKNKKKQEEESKKSTDLLADATDRINTLQKIEADTTVELIAKLRAQAEVDKDHAEDLKKKADQLERINNEMKKQKGYGTWGGIGKFGDDLRNQMEDPKAISNGIEQLGKAVLGGMSKLNTIVQGFTAGGPLGAIIAVFTESETFANILKIINPLIDTLVNALGSLLDPLLPLIQVVANVLNPIFKVLGTILSSLILPVMQLLFPIFKIFGVVLLQVAKIVGYAWNALASAINAVLGWLGVNLPKVNIEELSKAQSDLANLTWDAAMAQARNTDELNNASDAAKNLNESLSNVPTGFIVERARWRASEQVASSAGSASQSGNSDINYNIQKIEVTSNDPMEMLRKIRDIARRANARNAGSVLGDINNALGGL